MPALCVRRSQAEAAAAAAAVAAAAQDAGADWDLLPAKASSRKQTPKGAKGAVKTKGKREREPESPDEEVRFARVPMSAGCARELRTPCFQ